MPEHVGTHSPAQDARQTYDDVIRELIRTNSETKLIEVTERICKKGHFVEYTL